VATIATPIISPIAGSYREKIEVTLRCVTPNVAIYYTIDGSTPDATDNLYSDGTPISVISTTTIKAIGILSGFTSSAVASSVFTIVGLTYQYNAKIKHTGAGEGFVNNLLGLTAHTFYPVVSGDDGYSAAFNNSGNTLYAGRYESNVFSVFIRFPSISIPKDQVLGSAYIRLVSFAALSGVPCNIRCYFNASNNAVAPTTAQEFTDLALTSEVAWSAIASMTDGEIVNTPELRVSLQEVIDRAGWSSGNAVMILLNGATSSYDCYRAFSSIDYLAGTEKAQLIVYY